MPSHAPPRRQHARPGPDCLAPTHDRPCCPVDRAGTVPTACWTIAIVSAPPGRAVACRLYVRTEWRYETPDGALLHQHAWNSDASEEAKHIASRTKRNCVTARRGPPGRLPTAQLVHEPPCHPSLADGRQGPVHGRCLRRTAVTLDDVRTSPSARQRPRLRITPRPSHCQSDSFRP